ncbi:MAG: ParB/RepB/Spo0J family partition protein [Gordonibacter sp.]|uniref:ParB/RepB/Spo0J family partition protein n=1 Tax=Gordonibacter sp. TaxID=1968902 RepID=UPI002B364C84|nr:ParB/RepB/Spo0J family partition protein [Gordonibacter sp.]
MSRVEEVARRFSLAGILDDATQTRDRFPIREIEVDNIADHPANDAYSMGEDGIAALAKSIRAEGLTDIPLVRKMSDGSFQMLSGHRRKAAFALLAKSDPTFAKIPCRVVENVSDEQSEVLLHTANYFTRQLNVMERAEATRALGIEVERLREADPSLKGERTADLKAAIIEAQTGRTITGKTVLRQEAVARRVEDNLATPWQTLARAGELTDADINRLAKIDAKKQQTLYAKRAAKSLDKLQTSALIKEALGYDEPAAKALTTAKRELSKALALARDKGASLDVNMVGSIVYICGELSEIVSLRD